MIAAVAGVLAVAALIAANALFVAAEFSFVAVDRAQVEAGARSGDRRDRAVLAAVRSLSFQLSGAQLGITVTSLAVGFIAEPAISSLIEPGLTALGLPGAVSTTVAVALALLLATVGQMVFGELVPKNWAIARPAQVARRVARPQRAFSRAAQLPIALLNRSANWLVRRLGIEPQEELRSARSPDELGSLVRTSAEQGTLPARTATLLGRSLRFGDRTAVDVMTPRVRVVALAERQAAAELLIAARESGHSRFPVYRDSPDEITGIVHIKHVFAVPRQERDRRRVGELAVPAMRVPTSLGCDVLLAALRRRGLQMAVVVDEYGGTAGVATLEDLVEELVGQVADEHDPRELPEAVRRPDGSWLLSGLLRGDEVAAYAGFRPPPGPYETVAGFVLARLGRLPRVGYRVQADGWVLTVTAMDHRRIDRIHLRRVDRAPAGGAAA